jgi:alpha-D-ribose 1-methylphosphonate 5-triphosphate synthase subunit PhnI
VGYSGVKGGMDAILAAERLVRRKRAAAPWSATAAIIESFRLAVDRVMGEAGLFDEAIAADAFRQAEGDLLEAAHLVRAYRSSLPRLAVSTPIDPDEMTVLRRIVPAVRTPGGPQLLGRTTDYTARVLERPDGPTPASAFAEPSAPRQPDQADHSTQAGLEAQPVPAAAGTTATAGAEPDDLRRPRRFYEHLLKADLAVVHPESTDDPEPFDVARGAARLPAPRSAVLASMARGETGALVALWYRSVRGPDGAFHEITVGEMRHGRLPVRVVHPLTGNPVEIGRIRVTEVEAIEDLNRPAEDRTRLDVGYGMVFGHNERKTIAMANLDIACRRAEGNELQQLLLLTTDGLDSSGLLEHLKLPHYVTFRSIVDRKLASRLALADSEDAAGERAAVVGQDEADDHRENDGKEGRVPENNGREQAGPGSGDTDGEGVKQPSFGGNF